MLHKANTIQNALPLVARAIGRKFGIEVKVGASNACTDGEVIYLPSLPFEDSDLETLAFGFLEHEAAHIRYTEFMEKDEFDSDFHHSLWNTFEDVRIERNLASEYPGFASTLRRLVKALVKGGEIFGPPDVNGSFAQKLDTYLLYRLRSQVLGQSALDQYAAIAEKQLNDVVPENLVIRVNGVLGRVPGLKSSREAKDLAKEILQIVDEETNPPENNCPGDDSKNGESESSAKQQGANGNGQEANPSSQLSNEQLKAIKDAILNASGDELPKNSSDQLADLLTKKADKVAKNGESFSAGMEEASKPIVGLGDPQKALMEVRAETMALRSRLRSKVEASRREETIYRRRGSRIDSRKIVNIAFGENKVYPRRDEKRDVNTAFKILIDRSTSMRTRIELARKVTLAAASALENIQGLNVAVSAFPGYNCAVDPITLFTESVKTTAARYNGIAASGGTPLLPALLWSIEQLMLTSEPRKILMIVTDGQPSQRDACRSVIQRCWDSGIEVIGLGIKVQGIENLFPIYECINELSDLPKAAFDIVGKSLTKQVAA